MSTCASQRRGQVRAPLLHAVTLRLHRRPEVKVGACQPPQSVSGAMAPARATSSRLPPGSVDQATGTVSGLIFGLSRLSLSKFVYVRRHPNRYRDAGHGRQYYSAHYYPNS